MAYGFGFIVGIIVVAMVCGIGSYYIWEKQSADEHVLKKVFFAFFCFFSAGVLGLVGGIPALFISYVISRIYRSKPSIQKNLEQDSHQKAS